MKYKHLTTGAIAELLEKNDLTVKVKVIETNEIKDIGSATFKRWWKIVPTENEADSSKKQNSSPIIEESTLPTMSKIINKLENLFDILNNIYFENKLSIPIITVQSTPKAFGHCSTKKIWRDGIDNNNDARYEINIGAEFLNQSSNNIAAVMCHEMIHLFCLENEIADTCQKGRYHNKIFKAEIEKRDLTVDYDRAIGYSMTKPTEIFIEKLYKADYTLEIPFARHTIEKKKSKVTREKTQKYFCPTCDQKVTAKQTVSLICGICSQSSNEKFKLKRF